MNARMILGHAACAALTSAVWEVAINLPAGDPGVLLTATGAAPFAIAAISLAVTHDTQRRPQPAQPAPQQRRPQPVRKELVR